MPGLFLACCCPAQGPAGHPGPWPTAEAPLAPLALDGSHAHPCPSLPVARPLGCGRGPPPQLTVDGRPQGGGGRGGRGGGGVSGTSEQLGMRPRFEVPCPRTRGIPPPPVYPSHGVEGVQRTWHHMHTAQTTSKEMWNGNRNTVSTPHHSGQHRRSCQATAGAGDPNGNFSSVTRNVCTAGGRNGFIGGGGGVPPV